MLDFVSVVMQSKLLLTVCSSHAESPVCVLHVYTYQEALTMCVLHILFEHSQDYGGFDELATMMISKNEDMKEGVKHHVRVTGV